MKTRIPGSAKRSGIFSFGSLKIVLALAVLSHSLAHALPRAPFPFLPEFAPLLRHEGFDEAYLSGVTNAEVVVKNVGVLRESWSGHSLERAGTVAPLVIPAVDGNGRTNVACDTGAVRLWVRPAWTSSSVENGDGPGHCARMVDLVALGNGKSATVFSLQVSADGSVVSLVGSESAVLLKADIAWRAGEWHQVVLNHGRETSLALDGKFVASGDGVMAIPPKSAALVIGSGIEGGESFEGEVDEVFCFGRPLRFAFHYEMAKSQMELGPVTEAELQAKAEQHAKLKAEHEAKAAGEGESGGGGMMMRMSGPSANCETNGPVYLTNVLVTVSTNDGWTVYFDIAGGTNGLVYDIFSTPSLAGNDVTNSVWTWLETGMTCETHYYTDQPNQMFYILTVPGADRDNDGMHDGWEWKHFGTLEQPADGDFDGDGDLNGTELANGTDPNSVRFALSTSADYVNTTNVGGTIEVLAGVPGSMAVLVNNTNFAAANWTIFQTNFTANLGTNDGEYELWVGLKGHSPDSDVIWQSISVWLDRVAPTVVITNPAVTLGSRPVIQLQGYSPEALSGIRYSITNDNGFSENMEGFVTHQHFDTNAFTVTTNFFQCFDIDLATGTNRITLRVSDLAGNMTTNNYSYVLDLSGDTNPPVVQIVWPQNGAELGGTDFTLRALVDDATARLTAEVVSSGVTNSFAGLIERNGWVWVENLPLESGTNYVTLTFTDAATNVTTTNLAIIKSGVELLIDPPAQNDLTNTTLTVNGSISTDGYKVWVNGVEADITGNSWSALNVPLNEGGSAVIQARAIPTSDNSGNGTGGGNSASFVNPGNPESPEAVDEECQQDKPAFIRCASYKLAIGTQSQGSDGSFGDSNESWNWDHQQPGWIRWSSCVGLGTITHFVLHADWGADRYGQYKSGTSDDCGVESFGVTNSYIGPSSFAGAFAKVKGTGVIRASNLVYNMSLSRRIRTMFELITGGKAGSHEESLFVLNTAGIESRGVFDPITTQTIPPGELRLLGKVPDAEGNVYKKLADNTTVDATTTAPGKSQYGFGATPEIVTVQSLTVVSNATHIVSTNWAAVKTASTNEYVYIEATLSKQNTNAAKEIEWTGGEAVTGNLFQRRVSKATSAKTTVTAALGSSKRGVTVWIIWGEVTVRHSGSKTSYSGTTDVGNDKEFPDYIAGASLGSVVTSAGSLGFVGWKVEIKAKISPTGLHSVLTSGWDFYQTKTYRGWLNDTNYSASGTNVVDDLFNVATLQDRTLDLNDEVFALDAPLAVIQSGIVTFKRNSNYDVRVRWNQEVASETAKWWVRQKIEEQGTNYNIIENQGGNGTTTLDENY